MNFKCGEKIFNIDLSQWKNHTLLTAAPQNPVSEEDAIQTALDHPIDSRPLSECVKPNETVCIVISDITRAYQRMWVYLPFLVSELEKAGVPDDQIFFLSANGTHRKQTQAEHRILLGDLADRFNIFDHCGNDADTVKTVGTTQYGNEIKLNRKALEADHIILTGAVLFHDLAGFGGGRKSLLPGIAATECIQRNHRLALIGDHGEIHPEVGSGKMENNPLNQEMQEVADWIQPTFILNVAIGGDGRISQAFAGHYRSAHEAGQAFVRKQDGQWVDSQADLVIGSAGGYPKDINLYQSTKAISNLIGGVRPGGTLLLFAECQEGFGYPEMTEILLDSDPIPELAKKITHHFSVARYIGYWTRVVAKKIEIVLVSTLPSEKLKAIGIQNFPDAESAIQYIQSKHAIQSVLAVPKAGQVFVQNKGGSQHDPTC